MKTIQTQRNSIVQLGTFLFGPRVLVPWHSTRLFSWAYLDNNSIWKLPTLVKRGHIKQLGTGHWKNEHSDDLVRPPQMHGYHPPVTRVPKKPRDGPIWNPTSNRHYYCEVCSFKLGHSSMNLRGFVCLSSWSENVSQKT